MHNRDIWTSGLALSPRGWLQQIQVAYSKRFRQLVEGYDRRVAAAILKAAQILLAEPRNVAELLLRQALFKTDSLDVLSY